jgi:hypothetical protein
MALSSETSLSILHWLGLCGSHCQRHCLRRAYRGTRGLLGRRARRETKHQGASYASGPVETRSGMPVSAISATAVLGTMLCRHATQIDRREPPLRQRPQRHIKYFRYKNSARPPKRNRLQSATGCLPRYPCNERSSRRLFLHSGGSAFHGAPNHVSALRGRRR